MQWLTTCEETSKILFASMWKNYRSSLTSFLRAVPIIAKPSSSCLKIVTLDLYLIFSDWVSDILIKGVLIWSIQFQTWSLFCSIKSSTFKCHINLKSMKKLLMNCLNRQLKWSSNYFLIQIKSNEKQWVNLNNFSKTTPLLSSIKKKKRCHPYQMKNH